MNTTAALNPSHQENLRYQSLDFSAAIEVFVYLAALAAAVLAQLAGWLDPNKMAIIAVGLLLSLLFLSWRRFDGGRHPCFFFLCMLTVFQAGRLLAYVVGEDADIFRITLMTSTPFDVTPHVASMVMLSITLSAISIYAPARSFYRGGVPYEPAPAIRFLPYLYFLFCWTLPIQLYKNYRYYEYAQNHGGYLVFFTDHGGMAASVPMFVRAISLLSLPALAGIFVLEVRTKQLAASGAAYFIIAAPVLLTGSRGAIFSLILSLWYVAKIKSKRRARLWTPILLAGILASGGGWIGLLRGDTGLNGSVPGLSQFLVQQGISLNVTEVAIAYRQNFSSHVFSYLGSELQSAFVAGDQVHYVAGSRFADDVAMFLSPAAYEIGLGSGSAYVAEAYVLAGIWGVVLVSLALGSGLHLMYLHSYHPWGLFLVAMILPDILWMARGGLLDWVSSCVRVGLSLILLITGWWVYRSIARMWNRLSRHDFARPGVADATTIAVTMSTK